MNELYACACDIYTWGGSTKVIVKIKEENKSKGNIINYVALRTTNNNNEVPWQIESAIDW